MSSAVAPGVIPFNIIKSRPPAPHTRGPNPTVLYTITFGPGTICWDQIFCYAGTKSHPVMYNCIWSPNHLLGPIIWLCRDQISPCYIQLHLVPEPFAGTTYFVMQGHNLILLNKITFGPRTICWDQVFCYAGTKSHPVV